MDRSGGVLHKVPFKLNVSPIEIHVQADHRTGLLSGDFQVGIHVQPGPMTRSQIGGVVDLVRLYATGDSTSNVQFFSQLPQERSQNQVVLEFEPAHWDIPSGHPYDLTSRLLIKNHSSSPFLVDLVILDSTPGLVAEFSNDLFTLMSGTHETILVSIKVGVGDSGRKFLSIGAVPGSGFVTVIPAAAVVNLDAGAAPYLGYYQITGASTYSFNVGYTITTPIQFATMNGIGSTESWGVNDVEFLSRHGLRFSQDGKLTSDPQVVGDPEEKSIMFFVEQSNSSGGKSYASKIVTLTITP